MHPSARRKKRIAAANASESAMPPGNVTSIEPRSWNPRTPRSGPVVLCHTAAASIMRRLHSSPRQSRGPAGSRLRLCCGKPGDRPAFALLIPLRKPSSPFHKFGHVYLEARRCTPDRELFGHGMPYLPALVTMACAMSHTKLPRAGNGVKNQPRDTLNKTHARRKRFGAKGPQL